VAVPKHLKVSYRGVFVGTPEIWSHSHSLRLPSGLEDPTPGATVTNLSLDALAAAWTALASALLIDVVQLTDIRCYEIGSDGRMVGNPHMRLYAGTSGPKGAGTVGRLPPQVAIAVTTEGANRGPGRFGRFYLPLVKFLPGPDLRMSTGDQTQVLNASKTFLLAMRDSYSLAGSPDVVDVNPINVSTLGGGGNGSSQEVTRIRVGRVYDTIRRRRSAMDESYATVSL
jgi:hypothetical protein